MSNFRNCCRLLCSVHILLSSLVEYLASAASFPVPYYRDPNSGTVSWHCIGCCFLWLRWKIMRQAEKRILIRTWYWRGPRWRSWLRHCATSQKVAGSIPDGVIGIFHWHNPGGKSGRCVGLTTLPPSCADCLEIWEPQPPGTLWACSGL